MHYVKDAMACIKKKNHQINTNMLNCSRRAESQHGKKTRKQLTHIMSGSNDGQIKLGRTYNMAF